MLKLRVEFPDHGLRIDPMGAWTVPTAVEVVTKLDGVLEYLEDPCRGMDAMAELSAQIDMSLATNPVVVEFEEIIEEVKKDAVQIILSDYHYWRGATGAIHLGEICRAANLGVSMHSNSHLGISLAAMCHVAAAAPHLTYDCDSHCPWSTFEVVRLFQTNWAFVDVAGWLHGTLWQPTKRYLVFARPLLRPLSVPPVANGVATLLYAKLNVNQFAAITLVMPWVQVVGTLGMTWAQSTGIFVAQLLGKNTDHNALDEFLCRYFGFGDLPCCRLVIALDLRRLAARDDGRFSQFSPHSAAFALSQRVQRYLWECVARRRRHRLCHVYFQGLPVAVRRVFDDLHGAFSGPVRHMGFFLLLLEELVKLPAFHLRLFKGGWKRRL
jgi:hypothetical protein